MCLDLNVQSSIFIVSDFCFLSLFFLSQYIFLIPPTLIPALWYFNISGKAIKSWAEDENLVQSHSDNYCHKEEEEEEKEGVPKQHLLIP